MHNLEPKEVFKHFIELCKIPHGSYNIDKISDFLYEFAKEKGLWCRQDEYKNVLIRKPATAGYEKAPAILLQGHMDMVAVKENWCELDLEKDGLDLEVKDGYLTAKGTSLGGDDGIALAYAMAILESDTIPHPELEVLFTVNEEVGMDGATGVDLSDFKACRMLNIDSEEEGILLAGCAGGTRLMTEFSGEGVEEQGELMHLTLKGLQGGHSGADIHKGRGNAICILARVVDELLGELPVSLAEISGGEKDNAIPRFAQALLCVPKDYKKALCDRFTMLTEEITAEFSGRENNMQWAVTEAPGELLKQYSGIKGIRVYPKETGRSVVTFLACIFDGVISMSAELEGIVETSLNLGVLSSKENTICAVFALRSSKKSAKDYLAKRLTGIAESFGAKVSRTGDYPAWEYRAESPLRDKMIRIFKEQYKKEPVVTVIHAGLECGILTEKRPDLDCVSFGPDILDIHTTRERLDIASTERTWKYILAILADKG